VPIDKYIPGEDIATKINEMVDQLNRLETHFHESLDTHYYTTLPRYSTPGEDDDE
jgi:hypothetical protein